MKKIDVAQDSYSHQLDVSLTALLKHKEAISEINNQITTINVIIATKQTEVQNNLNSIQSTSQLASERENLLADISLGVKTEGDLASFDQASEVAIKSINQASLEVKSKNYDIQQAIAGLEKKLDNLKSRLHVLQMEVSQLLRNYLMADANNTCNEYVNLAEKIKIAYMRLSGLNQLIKGLGGPEYFPYSTDFNLPSLRLSACDEGQHKVFKDIITSAFALNQTGEIYDFYKSLEVEFKEKGIL